MQIFEKACQARAQLVVTEAALMMLNSLEGDNWLAMEDVSLDQFDTMNAFDELHKAPDRDYQYDPEQELPARMEELVTGFHRQRAELLRLYVRLDALVVKLRELKIEWPEPFLGWILLYRSAIPTWQIPNVRSSMGKGFSRIAVRDALYHMFGPDSKPNSRDVLRVTQEAKHTGTEHVNLATDDWEMRVSRKTTSMNLMNGMSGMRTMCTPMTHGKMSSPMLKNTKVIPRIWNPLWTKLRKHSPLGKSLAVS